VTGNRRIESRIQWAHGRRGAEVAEQKQDGGPAQEAASGKRGGPLKAVAVERLPKHLQDLVVEGLQKGWTVEGVVKAVNSEAEGFRVAAWGVENFFWSSPRLWRERILFKKGYVDEMKTAITKPGSPEALLLDATLMTGLTDLYEKTRRIRTKDVATVSLQKETLDARKQLVALKVKRAQKEEELMTLRLEQIRRRNELLREQVSQLRMLVRQDKTQLEPELIHQIERIYGLAYLPDIPVAKSSDED
jgi:hypothetical protein